MYVLPYSHQSTSLNKTGTAPPSPSVQNATLAAAASNSEWAPSKASNNPK